jgi:hypothetical protein
MQLARQKLSKNNTPQPWRPPSAYGHHGAPPPAPPHTTISQHDVRQVYIIKTTVVFAAKAYQVSRIQEKNTVVVGPASDISTAIIPTSK